MTASHTTEAPTTLAVVMFTLAVLGTAAAIPHVIVGSINNWPPQLMTLHAVTAVGFWLAGFHYRAHPTSRAEHADNRNTRTPGPQQRNLDNNIADLAVRDEIADLERRLRETDG